jgi:hypothetical protein
MPAVNRWHAASAISSSCLPQGRSSQYSLQDIGRYYRCYAALMDHWTSVLPGKFLRVQHEEVLQDLEGQARRILISLASSSRLHVLSFTRPLAASVPRVLSSEQPH